MFRRTDHCGPSGYWRLYAGVVTSPATGATRWTDELTRARLHVVTGKGGTGKTTVAAALAIALATGGTDRVLLIEVEGRQGIAQLFDQRAAALRRGADRVRARRRRGVRARGGRRSGAAGVPGDVLQPGFRRPHAAPHGRRSSSPPRSRRACGTCCSPARSRSASAAPTTAAGTCYDAVVLDAPPTGRIVKFLDVTKAMVDLAKVGPIKGQSEGVARLLHSGDTAIHLVTLLEEMPVRETLDAVAELDTRRPAAGRGVREPGRRSAARPRRWHSGGRRPRSTPPRSAPSWRRQGWTLAEETLERPGRRDHRARRPGAAPSRGPARTSPRPTCRRLDLPELTDGVDVAGLYELAEALANRGSGDRRTVAGRRPSTSTR